MVQHKELTFMPQLTCEYELASLDILPKNYDAFLIECAQIYCRQAYPYLKTDDRFSRLNFNLIGQVDYVSPDDESEKLANGITKIPIYREWLGIDEQLEVHQDDFAVKVGERIQQMNSQLDLRFPKREGIFPSTHLRELDLTPINLEILASLRHNYLGGELYISLKTEWNEMQERSKEYSFAKKPVIAITLSSDCCEYASLESIMDTMEGALKSKYDFDRRKTIRASTERKTVELEEKRLRVA